TAIQTEEIYHVFLRAIRHFHVCFTPQPIHFGKISEMQPFSFSICQMTFFICHCLAITRSMTNEKCHLANGK
ncbi:MAG: hypothetical protein ACREEM_41580, partial [Blastocatellia bacterium]